MDTLREELAIWLREFDTIVRAVDYAAMHDYFTDDAVGFGTYGVMLIGRDDLERGQWSNVWPNIRGFRFQVDRLHCGGGGDLAWLACPWESTGVRPDGTTFDRPGRTTMALRRVDGRWRAVHTHFSLYPTR